MLSRRLTQNAFILAALLALGVSVVVSEGFSIPTKRHQQRRTPSGNHPFAPGPNSKVPSTATSNVIATGIRGGGSSSTSTSLFSSEPKCPFTQSMAVFGSIWGSMGVVYILTKSITRVLPLALEPFKSGSAMILSPFQWSMYALTCLFFAYAEGYKGFHLKFSPLVVKRSFSLAMGTPQGSVLNFVMAPLYSMGLIHATKKRLITSWSVTMGVAALVAMVKRLPGVWRCIMDAGVVVGLSYGSLSILFLYLRSWMQGEPPSVDACLPVPAADAKKNSS